MARELAKLVATRGQNKGCITKIGQFVSDANFEKISIDEMIVKKDRLVECFKNYSELNLEIQVLNPDSVDNFDAVEDNYLYLLSCLNQHIREKSAATAIQHSLPISKGGENSNGFKGLPKIEIPKFNGQVGDFYNFIELFTSVVHNNTTLSSCEKFYYLKSLVEGDALAIIIHLSLTSENYEEALRLLKQRYDDKPKIINYHIGSILDLNPIKKCTSVGLRQLVCQLRQHTGALKNLDVPIEHWDHILLTIMQRKLDMYTRKGFFVETQGQVPTLNILLTFLDQRATALESTSADDVQGKRNERSNLKCLAGTHASSSQKCKFCNKGCNKLYLCPQFKLANTADRLNFVTKHNLCKLCLNTHKGTCKMQFKCVTCKSKHNSLLHDAISSETHVSNAAIEAKNVDNSIALIARRGDNVLLPTIKVKLLKKDGQAIYVRALLDSGSQVSFIVSDIADLINCNLYAARAIVQGIGDGKQDVACNAEFSISSLDDSFSTSINCCVVKDITCNLPQFDVNVHNLKLPSHVRLADKEFYKSQRISMLLGCNIFFQLLLREQIPLSIPGNLCLQNTRFGYVVAGVSNSTVDHISGSTSPSSHVCLHQKGLEILNNNIERFWECEKVPEVYSEASSEQRLAEEIFQKTVELKNNQFQVDLPFKQDLTNLKLGDSFSGALKRYLSLEKRLKKDSTLYESYKKFILEYISLGHAQYIDISSCNLSTDLVYFLPHHCVINEGSKTTTLRVVFDGSMKTNEGISLNDVLLNGEIMQNDLFGTLVLFRLYKFVLIADIQKMFRALMLNPAHCQFQNILWRDNIADNIQCIQLRTVTYGLKSSTYLATRCLYELAHRFKDKYPFASQALLKNTYVDDINLGANDLSTLLSIKNELIELLAAGNFKLHKWCSNEPSLLQDIPLENQSLSEIDISKNNVTIKTLGISYNVQQDVFIVKCPKYQTLESYSKRDLLSFISKIFDPLGMVGPILVNAKIIMQAAWLSKTSWDEPLTIKLNECFKQFVNNLQNMSDITIKRNIKTDMVKSIELIGFSDASNQAYGCCIYLRTIDSQGNVDMNLLCSKSRINPIKRLTVPRLELNGALLLATLAHKIIENIKNQFEINTYLYVDSMIVLSWLKLAPIRLDRYVANRVTKILEISKHCSWHYVNTNNNPADCLSRGVDPHLLQANKLWWHGPKHMHSKDYRHDTNLTLLKVVPETNVSAVVKYKQELDIFKKYSFNRLQKLVAYIYRFINNCRLPAQERTKCSYLKVNELDYALKIIIKHDQHQHLMKEINCLLTKNPIKSNLIHLCPFLDGMGLIRVGGRLQHSNLSYDQMHPIILPKQSTVTKAIIEREHKILLHAGQKLVLSNLNQKYHLINGRREVSHVIQKCIICFKLKAKASEQLMGSLPEGRVSPSRVFEKVGIDYGGPFHIKMHRVRKPLILKSYIVLFVCFITKAVHIELVTDLTTESFINCLKRFISRRNRPSEIHCDNASTFKGASNVLNDLYKLQSNTNHQSKVQGYAAEMGIQFKFIPSYSPVFGGLWEAGIKSTKYHIKRVVGDTITTYEELNTILIQIEGILNSRPLAALSTSDTTDYSYLTPGHFLTGKSLSTFPEPDLSDVPINRLSFWKKCTKMVQSFWKQWHKQYLVLLQNRPKWFKETLNIKEGSLVIIRDKNTSPLRWPMARVVKIHPGKDGKVRALDIKTSKGFVMTTSIGKVCLLPVE